MVFKPLVCEAADNSPEIFGNIGKESSQAARVTAGGGSKGICAFA